MNARFGKALMDNWAEYLDSRSGGASYLAICTLGDFENLLRHDKIHQPFAGNGAERSMTSLSLKILSPKPSPECRRTLYACAM